MRHDISYLDFGTSSTQFRAENTGIQQVSKMPEDPRINPLALPISDAAKLLSKAGGRMIRADQIEDDIAAGAPTNGDGTISLISYAAWMAREERARGD